MCATLSTIGTRVRKRAVGLALNEGLVAEAKT